ncbi:Predicted membrane protein [Blastococcus fimeti]|nr:Predicted membrane protein [Blastococcus fimeti]
MPQPARSMAARRRRRIDAWLIGLAAVVVAVVAFAVAALAGGERIARLWVSATIAEDGSARIVEVIDYDFGVEDKRGIYRDVPGLRADDPVEVSSPDAPDDVVVTGGRLRIGDPDVTVTGQHRYELSYTLDGVTRGGQLAWDAVGTGWEVPIDDVEVHVVGAVELDADTCSAGDRGATNGCALRQTAPGHLVARVEALEAGQGVTVYATEGRALDTAPDAPSAPTAAPAEPGIDPLVPAAIAGLLALVVGALVSLIVRRAGREHVPSTGLPTVVVSSGGEARIDFEQLGGVAMPSASIPRDISPAQGGVLLAGSVAERHKTAWLVDLAVRGVVDLEPAPDGGTAMTLVRLQDGEPAEARLLDRAFAGRTQLQLGGYDESFAAAWTAVGTELSTWQQGSGLWDDAAELRTRRVRWLGVLAAVTGLAVVGLAAWLSTRQSALPLALAALGGAVAGGGVSAALRAWELRVLTPQGSSTWLRVESLRRYLAECAPTAIDDALAEGTLGDYTAWALALGEAERWSTLAKSVKTPDRGRRDSYDDRHWQYATYGPVFVTSCSSASTAPSSSSSSGGGSSGSVGGGAGGGGGGSW